MTFIKRYVFNYIEQTGQYLSYEREYKQGGCLVPWTKHLLFVKHEYTGVKPLHQYNLYSKVFPRHLIDIAISRTITSKYPMGYIYNDIYIYVKLSN